MQETTKKPNQYKPFNTLPKIPFQNALRTPRSFCPLLDLSQNCLGEKCAWWDNELKICGILAIARFIRGLGAIINEVFP